MVFSRYKSSPLIEKCRRVFCRYRYLFSNINTREYWDKEWEKEIAKSYRKKPIHLYNEIISRIPENSLMLDVGCGVGQLMERAKVERRCSVYGVDISDKATEHIRHRGMNAVTGKVPPLPFPSKSFDVVVATELLEHVKSPKKVLNEIFRVSRKDGLCFFSVPLACMHPEEMREHNHSFSKNKVNSLLKKTRFDCTLLKYILVTEDNSDSTRLLTICKINKQS